MIYSEPPVDWRDLQAKVAEVLCEVGFDTEVAKSLNTVRGIVEVDVYAEDQTHSPRLICLCECKYWNRAIPQSVIHGFRTVVADLGAHYGLVISKIGFQPGSVSAAERTNLQLLTWEEFQDLFEDQWFQKYMKPTIYQEAGPLIQFTEPINSRIFREADKLDKERQQQFWKLREEYCYIAMLALSIGLDIPSKSSRKPTLPLKGNFDPEHVATVSPELPNDLIEASALRDFMGIMIKYCREGIANFDGVFGKQIR